MASRILVVDNYDSFVFNLVQYLGQLGAECTVVRNDEVDVDAIIAAGTGPDGYDGILISPGPGAPEDAGICIDLITRVAGVIPVLGVCLGHQAIAVAYGGTVAQAPELLHGKTSDVEHSGVGVLAGLPTPFRATRYHSLAVIGEVPDVLEVTGQTSGGVVMAMRHRQLPVEGVQFHPESVLTEGGHLMLANWLVACGDPGAVERAEGLAPTY